MYRIRWKILFVVLVLSFSHVFANFEDECNEESCDTEESEELHESYESECLEEGCITEELKDIAGNRSSINQMLNDFQARGFSVSACDRIGPCTASPSNNNTSADNFFIGFCTQASIDQHWDDFEMSKGDWDDGFGFFAPCDQNLPLGRTFNALNLLDFFGTSIPEGSNNFLPFFYEYAAGTDELIARCGSGCAGRCPNCGSQTFALHLNSIDDYIELFWPFFYGENVFQRASTLVHETRHDDKDHDGGRGCPNGASCDSTWGFNGTSRFQLLYLWWLSACSSSINIPTTVNTTTGLRNQLVASANLLWARFNNRPTRAEVFGAGVANPTAPARVPPLSSCPP